jgi:hypothetical protein
MTFFLIFLWTLEASAQKVSNKITDSSLNDPLRKSLENMVKPSSGAESLGYKVPTPQILESAVSEGGVVEERNQEGGSLTSPKIEMIVDSSGSMGQALGEDKTKMFYLKKMISRYFTDQWKEEAQSSLRVYGAQKKGKCDDNHLAVGFGEKSLGKIESAVGRLEPLGMTPLFKSVQMASTDLQDYKGPKRIIVFTDGEDTCGGDPCKVAEDLKKNPQLDLKIYVVAIGFKPEDKNFKKVSCLGDTKVAESEADLFNALGDISSDINKDRINLRVISPDPAAVVHLSMVNADGSTRYFRSFTASWGATVPPGNYQAVVELNPVFKFSNFVVPTGKVVTLTVGGEGRVRVLFIDSILNVEVLDKNRKVVRKFKSDLEQKIPAGRWTLRIYQEPFFEKIVKKFDVYPNGHHDYTVVGAGAIKVESPSLRGVYVYDRKKNLIGNYLTQMPMAIPSLEYMIHVDKNCSFENVPVIDRQIKTLECRSTP